MGFLDSIRDRFRGEADDGYYEDDYYDGYEDDQGYDEPAPRARDASRVPHLHAGQRPAPAG